MNKTTGAKPWHQVVTLRDELREDDFPIALFAADLYDVVMEQGPTVYKEPRAFFEQTYATHNIKELAKDVLLRLAGKSDRAVRQLALTYGGGKTHILVMLYHLVNAPKAQIAGLPAVEDIVIRAGVEPPRSRVGVVVFDRLDVVLGMHVAAPNGETRSFLYPWSVLAWQLGGEEGLRALGQTGETEREEPPFTNVLEDVLRLPERDGLATLILLDEVLMWARTKVDTNPIWRNRLQDFFQCLTQAAMRVNRCAIVASLLANDPSKNDPSKQEGVGESLLRDLAAAFGRVQEENIQPVEQEDVPYVLRRRFFTAESLEKMEARGAHASVSWAVAGIAALDEESTKKKAELESRFFKSFPFDPDVTNLFFTKWTQLRNFQQARGVLRLFAISLRDAERWQDPCPLVATNVFLNAPGLSPLSASEQELADVADAQEYEDQQRLKWRYILPGELDKARTIQDDFPTLRKYREVEQAVMAVFLHSQPVPKDAKTRELMLLLGPSQPDQIELEKALRRWTDESWFLDESAVIDTEPGQQGQKRLPKSWRLGFKPNLRHMHHDARDRVTDELVAERLEQEMRGLRSLTDGAKAAGARVHNLPDRPRDIEDDSDFHYAVLGPRTASESGKPSEEAKRFINETTGPDRPREHRNAIALAVPTRDGVAQAKDRIRDHLAWLEVESELRKKGELDPLRAETLRINTEAAKKRVPDAIRQAYCLCVVVATDNEIQAFKFTPESGSLFTQIMGDPRSRIQSTPVTAEALLPGGPYNLWREGEEARRLRALVGAFAQNPSLPKMLSREAIEDTLIQGCEEGLFVFRYRYPDGALGTFWKERPPDSTLSDVTMEVVLPEKAALARIAPSLIVPPTVGEPERLPGFWNKPEKTLSDIVSYFAGGRVVMIPKEGYEEPFTVPQASRDIVADAVRGAVASGKLWLTTGRASVLGEEPPPDLLIDTAVLQAPPAISPSDILPESLPEAWDGGGPTVKMISDALSQQQAKPVPWSVVRETLDKAYLFHMLEPEPGAGSLPRDYAAAQGVRLHLPGQRKDPSGEPRAVSNVLTAESELRPNEIQDLADVIADIAKAAVGYDLKFGLRVELGGTTRPPDTVIERVNSLLSGVSAALTLD